MEAVRKRRFFFFEKKEKSEKIGTIKGVFIPNILQMIGVILFMRLGWILGHVGMTQMAFIIGISSTLLLITSFSMTSIVSNMKVEGGGSYYLISRTLGIEFGSAIGILLCASQLVSIALSVSGFSISLYEFLPGVSLMLIKAVTLISLMGITYISTDLALKTQVLIFVTLSVSVGSVFLGGAQNIPSSIQSLGIESTLTFWVGFAMFFPATTGIESGMSMSGDLKNPSKSLPLGTIASVIVAFLLYFNIALFLSKNVTPELLRSYPMIAYYLSSYGFLVVMGIWGATLSSGMGSILGAPRIMQAIANDGILPRFLGKGYGPTNQPKIAMIFVFFLGLLLTLFTDINQIIPILTMACLISYGLINFVCFFQAFLKNPSWRPSFRVHWVISLLGSLGCLAAMFMINAGATFVALTLTALLCVWTASRKVEGNWDDLRYGLFSYFVHEGTKKLLQLDKNPKSWRPDILTLFGSPFIPKSLAFFSHTLNQEKGLLTFTTAVLKMKKAQFDLETVQKSAETHLTSYKIPSFVHVYCSDDHKTAFSHIVSNYGFGPLKPNTVIASLRDISTTSTSLPRLLTDAHAHGRNILLLKDDLKDEGVFTSAHDREKQINLWWGGAYQRNFDLCLALSHILQGSQIWWNSKICIKMLVPNEETKNKKQQQFERYKKRLRIKNLVFDPIVDPSLDFFSMLTKSSQDASLTFLGLRCPTQEENLSDYENYYNSFVGKIENLNNVVFALAGEPLSFDKIFFD